jgi:agmatine/peptidylarginine deiminase
MKKVSERALFSRIARKLAHEGSTLHKCRYDSRWFNDLGPYYVVDERNSVQERGFELLNFAEALGVLKPSEIAVAQ